MVTCLGNGDLAVEGRIDSSNAQEFETELFSSLDKGADSVVVDAKGLSYISSAGLRVLLKLKKSVKGEVVLRHVADSVYAVLEMTGFTKILTVHKALRELSVDGCKVIGRGFYGTVYLLDPDTVVKVYTAPNSVSLIENEQRMAKAAFLKGIPTAISYDMVRVGDNYGSVFEMLKAKSFNDLVIESPEAVDGVVSQWCALLKQVHETEMEPGELPSARRRFLEYVDVISPYLDKAVADKLRKLLTALPEVLNVVHGDFQMKNVMLSGEEPMLIDMDTLAVGQPVFDLAGLYVTYKEFSEDDPENTLTFLGIPESTAAHIWSKLIETYFGTTDSERLDCITDRIRIVAAVRFLFIVVGSDLKNGELGRRRIEHTRRNLDELLARVDSLAF